MFSFVRNCQTVFQVPVYIPTSSFSTLEFLAFLILAILIDL